MIKATSVFNKEKVTNIFEKEQKRSFISSLFLMIFMIIVGVLSIVSFLKETGFMKWVNLVVGIVFIAISWYPLVSARKTSKAGAQKACKDMGVEKNEVIFNYEFREKRFDVFIETKSQIKHVTEMMRNVSYVKKTQDSVRIYMTNGELYYLDDIDITEGNKQKLISLFLHNNIRVK